MPTDGIVEAEAWLARQKSLTDVEMKDAGSIIKTDTKVRLDEGVAELESHDPGCERYRARRAWSIRPYWTNFIRLFCSGLSHIGTAKVSCLTEHAHTISEARGRTAYSKHDLE
ncbi:unnamed protein product [Fusarium fujikuroi]|nr:unnamed protein product [Fusarium fujikuroi]